MRVAIALSLRVGDQLWPLLPEDKLGCSVRRLLAIEQPRGLTAVLQQAPGGVARPLPDQVGRLITQSIGCAARPLPTLAQVVAMLLDVLPKVFDALPLAGD